MQTKEQRGQRVPLRFIEYGREIWAAHEHWGSRIGDFSRLAGKMAPAICKLFFEPRCTLNREH
jgi:hypothetical protein